MKQENRKIGIEKLCKLFGKIRHAYYDHQWRTKDDSLKDEIVLLLVGEIRKDLPHIGTRKLLHLIKPKLEEHRVNIGRDYLFELLSNHKMLIRTRRRKAITTDSNHWMRKYSNLIKELQLYRPEQLCVSDITYIRLTNGFAYLSLITDAYSHKIMGYNLRKDMSAEGCLNALEMALTNRSLLNQQLIHHSDRGSQYCCKAYVDKLTTHNIAISMTENGDPYENAIAERLNGILKTEFKLYGIQVSFEDSIKMVEQSIITYNQRRPHASCDYLTPDQAHLKSGLLKKRWKNYFQNSFTNP
ncbi:MAG: IS3 family transposase [Ginsengibacter sp.]